MTSRDTMSSSDANSIRVLIADDNRDAAMGLGRLLSATGKETRVVHDGLAALAAVSEFRPHVILLDLGMPGMDGLEIAARLQSLPAGETVILIAVTGRGTSDDRQQTARAGFAAHLVKPIRIEDLEATLENLLSGNREEID